MNSSTHELVRDSQLLHRVKDKPSRWMRTNEIEALKGWKIPVACGLEKHLSHLLTQWNCFQIPPLAQWSGIQEMLMNGRNGWIYNHSSHLKDSDTGFVVRALGSIWPNSIRLQDLLPILTCLGCSHVSYHMKCTKTNMLMQRQFWSCFHQPTGVIPSR